MRLYRNERLIKRNKFLGRFMMFGGLGASFAAVIIVFLQPTLLSLAFGLMLAGGLFSQLGTAVHNRFGRSPRIDEVLDDSLKGLGDNYTMFHYYLSTNHALFTPAGVFALIPRDEKGEVRYESDQWILKLGKRRFGRSQKPLKDLERNAARDTKALKRTLTKKIPNGSEIPVNPLLVFIADEATLDLDGAPIAAVHRKKLKSYLRRLERQKSYSAEEIQQLVSAFNIAPDNSD
ncbi:MAG: hypothetical protein E3J69_00920 [Anaerolineales bacterium]|nr:MAG: hypothetical protein E3J69_00920 [Anaerolineales bacterium]